MALGHQRLCWAARGQRRRRRQRGRRRRSGLRWLLQHRWLLNLHIPLHNHKPPSHPSSRPASPIYFSISSTWTWWTRPLCWRPTYRPLTCAPRARRKTPDCDTRTSRSAQPLHGTCAKSALLAGARTHAREAGSGGIRPASSALSRRQRPDTEPRALTFRESLWGWEEQASKS